MKTSKLIRHLIENDVRRFRSGLAGLGLLFVFQAMMPILLSAGEIRMVAAYILLGLQCLTVLYLTVMMIQADALTGGNAHWQSRPISRAHLVGAKTVFMGLFIIAPWTLVSAAGWWRLNFSTGQMTSAAIELWMWTGGLVLTSAVLASWTTNLTQFKMALGSIVGIVILAQIVLQSWIVRWVGPSLGNQPVHEGSMMFGLISWMLFIATIAWFTSGLGRRIGLSQFLMVGGILIPFILLPMLRPTWLAPRSLSFESARVRLLEEQETKAPSDEQMLWSHFAVSGLSEHQMVLVRDLNGSFQPEDKPAVEIAIPSRSAFPGGMDIFNHSAQRYHYLSEVREFFPQGTFWFGNWSTHYRPHLPIQLNPNADVNFPLRGSLSVNLNLDVFEISQVGELPLRKGSLSLLPGEVLNIQRVGFSQSGIQMRICESRARILLSRDPRSDGNRWQTRGRLAFVVYHEASQEAYVMDVAQSGGPFTGVLNNESAKTYQIEIPFPELRARLTGVTVEQWMEEARLFIFTPIYRGSFLATMRNEDYRLKLNRSDQWQAKARDDMGAIEQMELPDHPAIADIDNYLEDLISHMPWPLNGGRAKVIQEKIKAVGNPGLNHFIKRLPLGNRYRYQIERPVLEQMATREHLPELLAAMQRDPELFWVFERKGWKAEVLPVLLALLPQRSVPLPKEALRELAAHCIPETYPDLKWRLIHQHGGQEELLEVIAQCSGFDIESVIRPAWKRARLGLASTRGLALPAAALGLPESLDQAIINLDQEQAGKKQRRQWHDQFIRLTGFEGEPEALDAWLESNLGRFQFNADTGKYTLN